MATAGKDREGYIGPCSLLGEDFSSGRLQCVHIRIQ